MAVQTSTAHAASTSKGAPRTTVERFDVDRATTDRRYWPQSRKSDDTSQCRTPGCPCEETRIFARIPTSYREPSVARGAQGHAIQLAARTFDRADADADADVIVLGNGWNWVVW